MTISNRFESPLFPLYHLCCEHAMRALAWPWGRADRAAAFAALRQPPAARAMAKH